MAFISLHVPLARGSEFFIVMTKGTKEYKDKDQTWFSSFRRMERDIR